MSSAPPRGTIRSMASLIFSSSPRRARSGFSTICTASAGTPASAIAPRTTPARTMFELIASLPPRGGEERAVQHRLREARLAAGLAVAGVGGQHLGLVGRQVAGDVAQRLALDVCGEPGEGTG